MEIIDLKKLASELPDEFKRTRDLITSTLDLNSARSDLRISAGLAAQAVVLIENPGDLDTVTHEDYILALTSSAVVYYARATKAASNHRRTFDIRSHFDDREKEVHEQLCALRDDAIAHYGPGEMVGAIQLRSDHLFVPVEGGNLCAVSRHTYGTSELGRMIADQAQRAVLIMQKLFEEREALLSPALNEMFAQTDLDAFVDAARVSLGDTIGDHEVARQLLDGPRLGHKRLFKTERAAPTGPASAGSTNPPHKAAPQTSFRSG